MIISRIIGGLGNQMFQYAAGRALSLRAKAPFALDISGFDGYALHNGFELSRVFAISPEIAKSNQIRELLGWRASRLALRLLARRQMRGLRGSSLVVEPSLRFWDGIRDVEDPAYLYGYWQSEKYFGDAGDLIRSDFTFARPLTGHNADIADVIRRTTSVSLHIRRGDYVTDSKTRHLLGPCTPEYYQVALSHMRGKLDNPELFIFSDDIDWVRSNLKIVGHCHFVDHNREKNAHFDMQLMSLCKHHIIANSSFSWWAAWLAETPETIVIAPKRWFADGTNAADLVPSRWLTL